MSFNSYSLLNHSDSLTKSANGKMRKRANQRLARLAKMTDDKGRVFLMYQI